MATRMDLNGVSSLWKRYKETKDLELRNQLVGRYLRLVKHIAFKVKEKLPDSVELDDLISDGVLGLIKAIEKFDFSRDLEFSSYSVARIRGAMFDGLREMDWVPRITRLRINKYNLVKEFLGGDNGLPPPTPEAIANYFSISIDKAQRILDEGSARIVRFHSMNAMSREESDREDVNLENIPDPKAIKPEQELSMKEDFDKLISCLSKREQIIMMLYDINGYKMREIGEILDLSESRISQMHSAAFKIIKELKSNEIINYFLIIVRRVKTE